MRKIKDYTIQGVIGTGGMGQVLRGIDPFGRMVAIKEILPEFVNNDEYRKRIDREINVMKQLNDPYVVKYYRSFALNDSLYIVMELVDGVNLEQYVADNGVFTLEDACSIMHKLLGTMQYVHEQGIIHRDLKPGNVMIRSNGEICVLDFGIAKDTASETGDDERTQLGSIVGTDGYMSPEQASGYTIDSRSDIYSLGCVMFYLLTGRHAFLTYENDSDRTSAEIFNKPFPQIADYRSGMPDSVQLVLDKAANKNMLRRYQTCREFSDDITNKCEKPQGQKPDGTGPEKLKPEGPKPEGPKPEITVSIGRENCDICIDTGYNRISRHHCDVEVKRMTGGEFYRIIDRSRNGTIVNGRVLTHGDKADIRVTDKPEVILSTSPRYVLDWDKVIGKIAEKRGSDTIGLKPIIEDPSEPIGPPQQYHESHGMSFIEAVKSCFNKYAGFSGRASRSEYWYFYLFNTIINLVLFTLPLISISNESSVPLFFFILGIMYSLAALLPGLAVTVRRLHDTDRSGFNILWSLLPMIGSIILLVFLVTPGTQGPNRYGSQP